MSKAEKPAKLGVNGKPILRDWHGRLKRGTGKPKRSGRKKGVLDDRQRALRNRKEIISWRGKAKDAKNSIVVEVASMPVSAHREAMDSKDRFIEELRKKLIASEGEKMLLNACLKDANDIIEKMQKRRHSNAVTMIVASFITSVVITLFLHLFI